MEWSDEMKSACMKDAQNVCDLKEALELILPMARGYAHQNRVGNNLAFIQRAEEALAKVTRRQSQ